MEQPTVLVWHAGYVYLPQCLDYVTVKRLGDTCLRITVVTSCMLMQEKEASILVLIPVNLPCVAGVTLHVK